MAYAKAYAMLFSVSNHDYCKQGQQRQGPVWLYGCLAEGAALFLPIHSLRRGNIGREPGLDFHKPGVDFAAGVLSRNRAFRLRTVRCAAV
jgi:hypothetical protein